MSLNDPKALLTRLFEAAVDSARPELALPAALPGKPAGRVVVIAAGKAAAAMAAALESVWGPCEGIALTRRGHHVPCRGVEVVEASHPVPDAAGRDAARRILALASSLGEGDTLVALISGGASALLSLGAEGVSLEDKAALTRELLRSGASIGEMNLVRRHVSAIKGGRLAAAAYPARVLTFAISDVPGDAPEVIGSGPTVADDSTLEEARALLGRLGVAAPEAIRRALDDPANETVKPGDARLSRAEFRMIATPQMALEAAAAACPLPCVLLGDAIEGEAREVGRAFGGIARATREGKTGFPNPCVLLSGGETTVTIPKGATGVGGRNVDFLMGFAEAVAGHDGVAALAADTDGVDGGAEVAGGFADGTTAVRARVAGRPLIEALDAYDGHGLFGALDDAIVTGPTLTNVNDFRAILVDRSRSG